MGFMKNKANKIGILKNIGINVYTELKKSYKNLYYLIHCLYIALTYCRLRIFCKECLQQSCKYTESLKHP